MPSQPTTTIVIVTWPCEKSPMCPFLKRLSYFYGNANKLSFVCTIFIVIIFILFILRFVANVSTLLLDGIFVWQTNDLIGLKHLTLINYHWLNIVQTDMIYLVISTEFPFISLEYFMDFFSFFFLFGVSSSIEVWPRESWHLWETCISFYSQ